MLGVAADATTRLAEKAFADIAISTNPRFAQPADIATLIERALQKDR
jgi:alcohol dehydrogenase class IV